MSTVLVSILMVVSLSTFAHVSSSVNQQNYQVEAARLAQLLLSEISSKCFEDPAEIGNETLGLESGEGSLPRSSWNDCDDYAGLVLTSIVDAGGNAVVSAVGWRVSVSVRFCNPATPTTSTPVANDMKLITLTLTDPGGTDHTFQTLRSKYGAIQQPADTNLLPSVEIELRSDGVSTDTATRILNQQETP